MFRTLARCEAGELPPIGYRKLAWDLKKQRRERLIQMADSEARWKQCHNIATWRYIQSGTSKLTEEDFKKFQQIDKNMMLWQKNPRVEWYGQSKFKFDYITKHYEITKHHARHRKDGKPEKED